MKIAGLFTAIVTLSSFCCTASCNSALALPSATHQGIKLTQSTESSGLYDIWVAADAIKVFSRSNGFYIAAQAPEWKVQVWRPDRKQYGQIAFDQFIKSDLVSSNRVSYLADLRVPLRSEKVLQGKDKMLIYYFPPIETVNGAGLFIADKEDGNGLKGGQKLKPKLICFDNNYAQQTSQIVGKLYNLPKLKGFPAIALAEMPNKKMDGLLECEINNRNCQFKNSELNPPSSYKRVPLTQKMFFTAEQADVLNEMMQ